MKLQIFQRKTFRIIYISLILLFIIISLTSFFSGRDTILDLDDDSQLSSRIESVEFTNKTIYPDDNVTYVRFEIHLEIWNQGPFRIQFQTGTAAFKCSYSITRSGNSTFPLESTFIMGIDAIPLAIMPSQIYPGIHDFQWWGELIFNGSVPDSNLYLPDGYYSFKMGDDGWINRYNYDVNVSNGIISHFPEEKPALWGDSTVNLGNPYWYIVSLTFLTSFLIEWRINVKEGLPKKQNGLQH